MNQLALLRPAARRSVLVVGRAPLTSRRDNDNYHGSNAVPRIEGPDAHERQRRQQRRRARSKNCSTLRKAQRQQRHRQQKTLALAARSVTITTSNNDIPEPTCDLVHMRQQLAALDARLALLESVTLVTRQNAQSAAVQLMTTYHEVMSRGYAMHDMRSTQFLESLFVADVRSPDFTGLDVFRQQWALISRCHAGIRVTTTHVNVLAAEPLDARNTSYFRDDVLVVQSAGTTTCRISRQTIERIFPHVLADEPLVQWLIGREYAYAFTLVAHMNADGKIFQLESRVDLTSALLELLQDPFVTLTLVEAAAMTRAGNLLLQSEVRDAQNTIANGFL